MTFLNWQGHFFILGYMYSGIIISARLAWGWSRPESSLSIRFLGGCIMYLPWNLTHLGVILRTSTSSKLPLRLAKPPPSLFLPFYARLTLPHRGRTAGHFPEYLQVYSTALGKNCQEEKLVIYWQLRGGTITGHREGVTIRLGGSWRWLFCCWEQHLEDSEQWIVKGKWQQALLQLLATVLVRGSGRATANHIGWREQWAAGLMSRYCNWVCLKVPKNSDLRSERTQARIWGSAIRRWEMNQKEGLP